MNVHLAKFMMYYKIHEMEREGQSTSQISKYLVINRRTVKKYLAMSEQEYENFLIKQSERKKELLPYEAFVKERDPSDEVLRLHSHNADNSPYFNYLRALR